MSLNYKVGKYDNFKLDEAISLMRRVESDLHANRYTNANPNCSSDCANESRRSDVLD